MALLEFFLLPVPPDPASIPLAVARPESAFGAAQIAAAGSVTAGSLGYAIGRKGGRPAVESRFTGERVEASFDRYGLAPVGISAFVPVPAGHEADFASPSVSTER